MSVSPVISPISEKYLKLHLCRDVGSIRFGNLLREIGDIDAVLGASMSRLMSVDRIGEKVAENIARGRDEIDVAMEVELAARHGVQILSLADDAYPVALRTIPDPPPCIYIRGHVQREDAIALAIVGSRRCSRYGAEQAERFGALLANVGMTVVSGMARGIDTCAHRGALAVEGRTIAVIGCGLSHLYPPESTELAESIIEHGALMSELPMATPPDSKNFPPRNRIVAGLSLGVLVVEAARRSGALISARLALEYNREVFAVPGRVDAPFAGGCHDLIKRNGAKLVTSLEDILEELGESGSPLLADTSRTDEKGPTHSGAVSLTDEERQLLGTLDADPLSVEALCDISGMPPARVATVLTSLQLKGVVRQHGPDLYERIHRA